MDKIILEKQEKYKDRLKEKCCMGIKEKFISKIKKIEECWVWQKGKRNKKGYGGFNFNNKTESAHRVAYILFVGKIPKGLFVCHKCDNPPCVNPEHLFLGTNKDNIKDAQKKGRIKISPHGTASRYSNQKCRCAACRSAKVKAVNNWRKSKQ